MNTTDIKNINTGSAPITEVYAALSTSQKGLSEVEAENRLKDFGSNRIASIRHSSVFKEFVSHFISLMAILLWVSGAIAICTGSQELGIAIWMVNIINGLFSFWQEHQAQKMTDSLMNMLPTYVSVLRDSELKKLDAQKIVPGDIIELQAGNSVPADARVISTASLQVDQSSLTGETVPESKTVEYKSRRR